MGSKADEVFIGTRIVIHTATFYREVDNFNNNKSI